MTARIRRAGMISAVFALLLPLAACAATTPAPAEAPSEDAGTTTSPSAAADGGESYGCTEGVLAYAREYGYPAAKPIDPAALDIPLVSFDVEPDCYIVDEVTGAVRYGAFWSSDPQGVLSALGGQLNAAGYVQSDDYGPLVWWVGGDDPLTAEHAISAAPQPVDGVEMLWATW